MVHVSRRERARLASEATLVSDGKRFCRGAEKKCFILITNEKMWALTHEAPQKCQFFSVFLHFLMFQRWWLAPSKDAPVYTVAVQIQTWDRSGLLLFCGEVTNYCSRRQKIDVVESAKMKKRGISSVVSIYITYPNPHYRLLQDILYWEVCKSRHTLHHSRAHQTASHALSKPCVHLPIRPSDCRRIPQYPIVLRV